MTDDSEEPAASIIRMGTLNIAIFIHAAARISNPTE
jgi:hypothetical protein